MSKVSAPKTAGAEGSSEPVVKPSARPAPAAAPPHPAPPAEEGKSWLSRSAEAARPSPQHPDTAKRGPPPSASTSAAPASAPAPSAPLSSPPSAPTPAFAPPPSGAKPTKSDEFDLRKRVAAQREGPRAAAGQLPARRKEGDALSALNQAQEPGVYFKDHSQQDGHTEEAEDPELAAAVEAAIGKLFGVPGIRAVAPGENEAREPVVLIVADRGFTDASMRAVPEKVGRFSTLVALPYDLLPLRRQ